MDSKEYARGWREQNKHPCLDCGKPISHKAVRCGSCNTKWLWKIGKLNSDNSQKGKEHHAWKGGRYKKDGYWLVQRPEHHRADADGYVREHIIVWEEANNKPLPQGWIVHHLNGIRGDNRPINLVGLPDRKHRHILAAKAKRIQELEALLNNQHQLL